MLTLEKRTQKKNKQPMLFEIIEDNDPYTSARAPYVSSEYISPTIIPIIIKHFFNSSELVLSFSPIHSIYKIQIKDLLVSSVKNWTYNRPPDAIRCPDIARYIYNSRKPIDSMLFLSFNNTKEIFEVLDGIHRITALKIIKNENSKQLNLLEPSEFGSGNDANWLFEQYVLVNIRFNATFGELREVFENLNKSQTVPDLYIYDHAKEKRDIIDTIANEWMVKYKKHFTSSANPIGGNTNRNRFVELLDKLYEKHQINEKSCDDFRQILDNANKYISSNIPTKTSIDMRLKCKESGCYLFIYKNDKLEEII